MNVDGVTCDPADFVLCEESCDASYMSTQTVAQEVKLLPWILQLGLSSGNEHSKTFIHREDASITNGLYGCYRGIAISILP